MSWNGCHHDIKVLILVDSLWLPKTDPILKQLVWKEIWWKCLNCSGNIYMKQETPWTKGVMMLKHTWWCGLKALRQTVKQDTDSEPYSILYFRVQYKTKQYYTTLYYRESHNSETATPTPPIQTLVHQLSQNPSPPTATSTALDLGVDLSRGCFRQHLKALTFEHSALCTLEIGQWSKDGHWWPFWTGSIFEPIQRGGSLFIQPMALVGFLLPPINWNVFWKLVVVPNSSPWLGT